MDRRNPACVPQAIRVIREAKGWNIVSNIIVVAAIRRKRAGA